MTIGAPKMAVTAEIDTSVGANTDLAIRSQNKQKIAPPKNAPGMTTSASIKTPTAHRMIALTCGFSPLAAGAFFEPFFAVDLPLVLDFWEAFDLVDFFAAKQSLHFP